MRQERDRNLILDMKKTWVEKELMTEDTAAQITNAMEEVDFLTEQLSRLVYNGICKATKNYDEAKLLDAFSEYDMRCWEVNIRFERLKNLLRSVIDDKT